jgi:phage-related protein
VFVKKTEQTPRREINLAMERAKEVEEDDTDPR